MWNWNQFKNLPRNRDLSPQEQSRQYFIYQSNMMYEANLNNTVAAAAAVGSGGGSLFTVSVPDYPFATIQLRYSRFDFFDDTRFAPTPAELAAYPNIPAEILVNYSSKQDAVDNLDGYYRSVQDAFSKRQFDLLKKNSYTGFFDSDPGPELPYLKGTDQYPLDWTGGDLYTEPTTLYYNLYAKGPMALIEVPASPKRLGFSVSTFKEPIANYEDLPTEGNELGDCRYVYFEYNTGNFDWFLFVWDGFEWDYNDDTYYEDQMGTFRARREEYVKQLNEVLLFTRPFVWSAEYLPGYRLNKDTFFGFDLGDFVSMNIIGENETIVLSYNDIENMTGTFIAVANGFLKAVYNLYINAYSLLTLEYRKGLTELYNQFLDRMHNICEFPDDWYITNTSASVGTYWQAMLDGNKYLTYQLRPAYVKNLKEAMASVKSLIEYASGSSITYTTN